MESGSKKGGDAFRCRFGEWITFCYDGAIRETREGTPPLNQQYTTYKNSRNSMIKVAAKMHYIPEHVAELSSTLRYSTAWRCEQLHV